MHRSDPAQGDAFPTCPETQAEKGCGDFSLTRRQWLGAAAAAPLCARPGTSAWAPAAPAGAVRKGGAANIALVSEPPGLDPMISTADLVGTIMQHVYEPLYTVDAHWNLAPMLAEAMPVVTEEGKVYSIPLRKGVKLHNGRELNADDVVASLQRWLDISPRGKAVKQEVESLTAPDASTVRITLKAPYAPLVSQLAANSGMAAIMAKESLAPQITNFIGTGPYKFKERRPDQFVVLVRFDDYSARTEAASGYAGRRVALLDELRFIPVPSPNTRVEGALSGQFHFSDQLSLESISRLEESGSVAVPVMIQNFGFPYIVLNNKEGVLVSQAMRRAVQTAVGDSELMDAAFGDKRFYSVGANFFPEGTPFYSLAGAELYDNNNPKVAKDMAAKAGYGGQPIRILASRQYGFHYNMALVFAEQLKKAGFKTELQVVDWATLIQRRTDPKLWDIFFSHSNIQPEPMLSPPQFSAGAPGWWESDTKKEVLGKFNSATDLKQRSALWGPVQKLVFEEVPFLRVGTFNSLAARSNKLEGFTPGNWPFFWNTSLRA
jgi:peptide/nickel transport system substrate-binding protein